MYKITVFGEPTGKGRPRFTKYGHAYTPDKTRSYEQEVKYAFLTSYHSIKPIEGAISVAIMAYYDIPRSYSKAKREQCINNTLPVIIKPDVDNISKIILDSLNGLAYVDDKQITKLEIQKKWSDSARVEVVITEEE